MKFQTADVEILTTNDGSPTLISNTFGITYHSKHGAVQESKTIFINAGLDFFHKNNTQKSLINILEIGFGTGLNALLSFDFAKKHHIQLSYTSYEAFPVEMSTILNLDFQCTIEQKVFFQKIHQATWNKPNQIDIHFNLHKVNDFFQTIDFSDTFNIIYFDAFAPNAQPELWTKDMLLKMYNALKNNGVLVTYCAKGEFKRTLKSIGFYVEALPGPIGKREMTRAIKG